MKGVQYITNDEGRKSAVIIDIDTYGEQIEDFLDGLEALERMAEPEEDYRTAIDRIIESKNNASL